MRADRLLTLAKHLRSGNLGHKVFDYSVLNRPLGHPYPVGSRTWLENGCGSSGCAIGELPFADPKAWEFRWDSSYEGYYPLLRTGSSDECFTDAATYFEITEDDADYLFMPVAGEENATAEEVALKIEGFVCHQQQTVAVQLEPLSVEAVQPEDADLVLTT